MAVDTAKLNDFLGKAVGDLGAALHAALVVIGDRTGLYRALAEGGPMSSEELARRTECHERYVREWLCAQAAGGYVTYDAEHKQWSMTEEQAFALAAVDGPDLAGAFQLVAALVRDEPKIREVFRSGKGVPWGDHDACLFEGTERFFRPGYAMNLVSNWLPALEGVSDKLTRGAKVADVGCGHGASTILMAQAFPKSKFTGYDSHAASIEKARAAAKRSGVGDRVHFEVATAKSFPGKDHDLVAVFDCLHDMGDPVGAAKHVLESLKPDGTWMVVEPFAHDHVENNLNPIGRMYYCASTLVCTPASLSQEVGLGLGAQAGESRLGQVAKQGGFKRFRRATETPFNLVFEVRP